MPSTAVGSSDRPLLNRRRLLAAASGLSLVAVAAACGAAATNELAASTDATASANPTPTAVTVAAPTETKLADETSEPAPDPPADTADKMAEPSLDPLAATRPLSYNPDDRESVISRYAQDRARLDAVLTAGVPVIWVTDAIW